MEAGMSEPVPSAQHEDIPASPAPGRVLVTGAYGFIGAAYCAHLEAAGVPYLGAVRMRTAHEIRDEIVALGNFAEADWDGLFARMPVRQIVHLAARAHRMRDDAEDPAALYLRENVKVTDRLLAAARIARVQRFVFASTVKVHGASTPPGVVLRETDPLAPADDYAYSKAVAEKRVRQFGEELGLGIVVLRLPLVYGPGVKANFAALVDAVRARRILPFGAIVNQRSLLGLTNLCSALDSVREHPDAAGNTFFVSDADDVSTPELVRAIATAYGVRPRLWRVAPRLLSLAGALTGRRGTVERLVASFAIDDARIRRTLGWRPPLSLAEELAKMAAAA
jgi:UDP-glucose 4-epimerase